MHTCLYEYAVKYMFIHVAKCILIHIYTGAQKYVNAYTHIYIYLQHIQTIGIHIILIWMACMILSARRMSIITAASYECGCA